MELWNQTDLGSDIQTLQFSSCVASGKSVIPSDLLFLSPEKSELIVHVIVGSENVYVKEHSAGSGLE